MKNIKVFKRIKIEYKIVLLLIFIGATILMPTIIIYFKHNKNYMLNENLKHIEKLSINIAKYIETSFNDKTNLISTIASNPMLIEHLKESNKEYKQLTIEDRDKKIKLLNDKWIKERDKESTFIDSYLTNSTSNFLKKQKEIVPNLYGELFLTNIYGAMISTTNKLSTLAHSYKYWWKASFDNGNGKIFFDDRGFDESVHGYVLGIVIPIKDGKKVIGILKANINIDGDFIHIFRNFMENNSITLQIVRTKGLIVAQKGVEPLSKSIDSKILHYLNTKKSIAKVVEDKLVAITTIAITNNKESFGGSYNSIDHKLGNLGEAWHIVISEDIDEITFNDMRDSQILIAILIIIVIILIFIIAIFLNKYISKPINTLLTTIESIARGDFSTKVKVDSPIDEINFLATSFNTMIENIKNQELEINKKHMEILNLLNELHLKRKEQLNQVLNSALDGVQAFKSIRDDDLEIIDFEYIFTNKKACEIIQKSEEELIGKRLLETLPGHLDKLEILNNDSLFDIYKEVVDSGESKELIFYFENDGIKEWFANKSVKLEDGFVVTFSVITKEMEQRNIIATQSRLATMGEMISAIAHQWRQPISIVMGVLANIEDLTSIENFDRRKLEKYIKRAEDTLEYMSNTIDDFRNFFNPSKVKSTFNLVEKVVKSYEIVSAQFRNHNIEFIFKVIDSNDVDRIYDFSLNENENENLLKYDSFKIYGYPSEFRQVLLNIFANSKDALIHLNRKRVIEVILSDMVDSYQIELRDNGIGISKKNLSKVFEPYFTTKKELQGSGLGLYMSKMIIEDSMRGKIDIKSKEDIGTSVFIKLEKTQRI